MKILKINSIFVWLGILLASLLTSCTTDVSKSHLGFVDKDYLLDDFNQIKFKGGYNVKLLQRDSCKVFVNTSEELQQNVKVWVENNLLHIDTKGKNIGTEEVNIIVTFKDLKDIKIEGGVFLTTPESLTLKNFNLNVEGGAHIKMLMVADTIQAKAAGGVNMEFIGKAYKFTAISEGAANIDADNFESEHVVCKVSGVGNASVYATKNLDATIEGVGKIGYRGDPQINKRVDGIGMVYKR